MNNIINELQDWLNSNLTDLSNTFQTGASDEELTSFEEKNNITLPIDFKAFYKTHNGQNSGDFGLTDMGEILNLQGIEREWNIWKKLKDENVFSDNSAKCATGIQNTWYDKLWIPFTADGNGNHYCIDLNPTNEGTLGQVISLWTDYSSRKIIATSFEAFLNQYVSDLKAGKFNYDPELTFLERIPE